MSDTAGRAAAFALLSAGFGAGVAQVLLLRELLVVAYGNELSMGILLACWLLAGALGSLLARRLRERATPYGGAAVRMVRLAVLPGPALVAALAFARAVPLLLTSLPDRCSRVVGLDSGVTRFLVAQVAVRPGELLGPGQIAGVALLAALLPAALEGAQFVIGCDLYTRARGRDEAVGVAYALDALGHLLGGVLLGWAVAIAFNPFVVAVLAGALSLVAGLLLAHHAFGMRTRPALVAGLGVVAVTLLAAHGAGNLHRASLRWRWHHQELLANVETIYGNFALTSQPPAGVYLYQNGLLSGASPSLVGTVDEFVHFAMLQHPGPARVLLIGGGIVGGLAELLRYDPELVYYLELDPALFSLAEQWVSAADLRALRDPRVRARQGDGRLFIKREGRESLGGAGFDVVLVCLHDPSTAQLNRFFTQEWFREVRDALAPGGILAWQLPGSQGYFSPTLLALNKCIHETARSVFPGLVVMPGQTAVLVAGMEPGKLTDDWLELERRVRELGVEAPYFEALLPDKLDPGRLHNVRETIEGAPPQPMNQDLRPIGFFLDQAHWLTQFHPEWAGALQRVQGVTRAHLVLPIAGATVVLVLLVPLRPVRTAYVPLSVAASGFVAMALEVALLLAFQAIYGYVYHKVGVIIGAFMVGLAVGSIVTAHWLPGKQVRTVSAALACVQGFGAALALVLSLTLPALWGQAGEWLRSPTAATVLFPLVTALVGLGVGVQFPLASAAWSEGAGQARAAAGLFAADLVGASVGAMLAGAVLTPVLGIPATCQVAAALGAGAALLLGARAYLAPRA